MNPADVPAYDCLYIGHKRPPGQEKSQKSLKNAARTAAHINQARNQIPDTQTLFDAAKRDGFPGRMPAGFSSM